MVIAVISSSSNLLKSYAKTTDFLLTRDSSMATTYLKLHLLFFVVVYVPYCCVDFCSLLCILFLLYIYVFMLYM